MDRDQISNRYRQPSIDASYQVSVHLGKQFQRKIFLEIDQLEKKVLPMAAIFVNGSKRNEQSKLGRMHLWKVFYKFRPDPFTTMATTGDSCF
jgi:hypothetical protein